MGATVVYNGGTDPAKNGSSSTERTYGCYYCARTATTTTAPLRPSLARRLDARCGQTEPRKSDLARHAIQERFGIDLAFARSSNDEVSPLNQCPNTISGTGTTAAAAAAEPLEPLLQALGRHNCVLRTWDTEDDLECVIPHNLLTLTSEDDNPLSGGKLGRFFEYRILKRYYRHPQWPITQREEER